MNCTNNKSDIKILLIETNKSCNLRCAYCFYNDYGRNNNELNLQNIEEIINNFINLEVVYLTGGEASLAKDFVKIIDRLSRANIKIGVFSNGLVLNNYLNDTLKAIYNKIDKLFISYDSISQNYPHRHNQDLTLSVIKKLIDLNPTKLIVKIGVNSLSIESFQETVAYLEKIGVQHLSINLIHNIKSNAENFELNQQQIKLLFDVIHKKEYLFDKKYITHLKEFFCHINHSKLNCPAGKSFGFIDSSNRFMPCPSDYQKINCLSKECICLWEMFDV